MKQINKCVFISLLMSLSVSCSNDHGEDAIVAGKQATLNMRVKSSTGDPNELKGEAMLNNVAVITFNTDGSAVTGSGLVDTDAEGSVELSGLKTLSGANSQLLVLANVPADILDGVSSVSDIQAKLTILSGQSRSSLTMSSPLIPVDIREGSNEVKEVLLTRISARIDIGTVSTNFSGSSIAGRSVRIDSVYVADIKDHSHFFSAADWGVVEAGTTYIETPGFRIEGTAYDGNSLNAGPTDGTLSCYAFENSGENNRPTVLMIRATMLASGKMPAVKGFFRAVINKNGLDGEPKHNFIRRNFVYRVNIGFTGTSFNPGNPPEDPTGDLNVMVAVASWNGVTQDVIFP